MRAEPRRRAALLALAALAMLAALAALTTAAPAARAQAPDPRRTWRTIRTPHFRVHFSEGLEAEARRAAANAERAWEALAAELVPPRGPVELVVADNVDFTQGYATPLPTNRIVVFAQPPVDLFTLRFYDDWSAVVITHELTHVFHIDRSRGVWGLLQRVMGRSPVLFPNLYAPSWVKEGLAVYYESRITGTGRLAATEHRVLARAAAAAGHVPRLDELSVGTSVFPGGVQAYAYGSLVFEEMARSRGPQHVRDFVERESGALIPYRLDHAARRSFGISFSDAWTRWRDSVERAAVTRGPGGGARGEWRQLTREGWNAGYPRWDGSDALLYASSDGRNATGAYRVGLTGGREWLGRRNGLSPNVRLPDGSLLFSQREYLDPFTLRNDLFVQRAGSTPIDFGAATAGQRRLTRGARLSQPDVRADGAIVAVQGTAGTTSLARVSPDGARIAPLTRAARDTQWTEPRWAPDGRHLVAVALTPGARSAVVVLDTLGAVARVVVSDRAVNAAPSWSADGRSVFWSSDRTGVPQVYVADVRLDADANGASGPSPVLRVSDVATGLVQPVPAPPAGSGAVAALVFRADGYHLAVADGDALRRAPASADSSVYLPADAARPAPPIAAPSTPYRPGRMLVPRYWLPIAAPSDGNSQTLGLSTSANDVLRRHAYGAQATVNLDNGDLEWGGAYRYARLGQPLVDVSVSQAWQYDTVAYRRGSAVDTAGLFRRTRDAALTLDFRRARVRTGASLALGLGLERRTYTSPVSALVGRADEVLGRTFPRAVASAAWSNTRRPARSVSPEDGVALSGSAQQRWQEGTLGPSSRRAVGAARLYKSLDLPGYAHHVLAVRVAGGVSDARAATHFSAGGVSGSLAELAPGIVVGDPSRTFGVRGFGADAQRGLRAAAASLEYRAPIAIAARGWRLLPVFLDRLSAAAFADAASAWCPAGIDRSVQAECSRSLTVTPDRPRWLASVGAELGLDAALDFDTPYRLRLGVAAPVRERTRAPHGATVYFTLGSAF